MPQAARMCYEHSVKATGSANAVGNTKVLQTFSKSVGGLTKRCWPYEGGTNVP